MKRIESKLSWMVTSLVLLAGYAISCSHQVETPRSAAGLLPSTTTLLATKVNTAPVMDGISDALWANVPQLHISPTVPDPGNNLFSGYIGQQYPATLRAVYDDRYIYFLAEFADDSKSVSVSPWYFNPATSRWAQEATSKTYDQNGVLTREGFGEDKLAMLWNIDNSTPKFVTQTCYASCHVFSPYMDYSVSPAVSRSGANSGNHYTNGASEKIDMWWAHLGKDALYNQMDDNYQDWAGGNDVTSLAGGNGNGRHVDGIVVSGKSAVWPFRPVYTTTPAQGALNNRQNLKLDGTGETVTVPLYIIPNATNYYHIAAADTLPGGKAVRITGVSSSGVLSFNDGSIDPNKDAGYLRTGDPVTGDVGAKSIAGYISSPLLGGRADISCGVQYTGTGWVVEFKRLLKTTDVLKQDVDFSSLQDQPFGVAIWNRSNNQHGIASNLVLKFSRP